LKGEKMLKFKLFFFASCMLIATSLNADKLLPQAPQTTLPELFSDVEGLYLPEQQIKPAHIMRERYVRLNPEIMAAMVKNVSIDNLGNPPDPAKFPKLHFNLFGDANYVSDKITSISYNRVTGTLANRAGFFQLIVGDGVFLAHLSVYSEPQGEYEISGDGHELYKIVQINQAKFAPD
jgi:hypothetical protein